MINKKTLMGLRVIVGVLFVSSSVFATSPPKDIVVINTANVNVVNAPLPVAFKPADQLICLVHGPWLLDGTAFPCTQASLLGEQPNYTLTELLADGWVIQLVGPSSPAHNRMTIVFFK
jgi:hypothetical protein